MLIDSYEKELGFLLLNMFMSILTFSFALLKKPQQVHEVTELCISGTLPPQTAGDNLRVSQNYLFICFMKYSV